MTQLSSHDVTPRKARECEWCGERIEKGEKCQYRSYIGEDGPMSGWSHMECWTALQNADQDDLWDGWMPGDWQRGSTEPR